MALLKIDGYNCSPNFDPDDCNLGASGIRGVAIYYKESLYVNEVDLHADGCRDHAWIEICVLVITSHYYVIVFTELSLTI